MSKLFDRDMDLVRSVLVVGERAYGVGGHGLRFYIHGSLVTITEGSRDSMLMLRESLAIAFARKQQERRATRAEERCKAAADITAATYASHRKLVAVVGSDIGYASFISHPDADKSINYHQVKRRSDAAGRVFDEVVDLGSANEAEYDYGDAMKWALSAMRSK